MTDEQRAERLRYHMYDTNEGIREHAERIVALEELVAELHSLATDERVYVRYTGDVEWDRRLDAAENRMRDLGIEVDE